MANVMSFCSTSGLFTLAFAAILHENLHGRIVFLPGKTPEALVIRGKKPTNHFALKKFQPAIFVTSKDDKKI